MAMRRMRRYRVDEKIMMACCGCVMSNNIGEFGEGICKISDYIW